MHQQLGWSPTMAVCRDSSHQKEFTRRMCQATPEVVDMIQKVAFSLSLSHLHPSGPWMEVAWPRR